MYTPANTINMKTVTAPQIRLGLQGASGKGKTFSALTFPNPVVLDLDNNLAAHCGRDIVQVPLWQDAFCDKYAKRLNLPNAPANRRDAITNWLKTEATKLEPEQSLILDSWTTGQDAFDKQTDLEPVYTKGGSIDEFAFWARKIDWSKDVMNILISLRCHVVVTFHEQFIVDDGGKVIVNQVVPLMQGKFVNRIGLYFTEFYRCCVFPKGAKHPVTGAELVKTEYLWQTKSDLVANCKSRMHDCPQFIPATFSSIKY